MKGKIVEMYAVAQLPASGDMRGRTTQRKSRKVMRYVIEYPDGSRKIFDLPFEAR